MFYGSFEAVFMYNINFYGKRIYSFDARLLIPRNEVGGGVCVCVYWSQVVCVSVCHTFVRKMSSKVSNVKSCSVDRYVFDF